MDNYPPPLFQKSSVIKLNDNDFLIRYNNVNDYLTIKLINPQFQGKHGYIMIYVDWCPHCRAKEDFWSYLADQFNTKKSPYYKENFRIGVIHAEDPNSENIISALDVGPVPKFMHVIPDEHGTNNLIDYQGSDLDPKTLMQEVCDSSPTDAMCEFNADVLNPPPIQ